MKVLACVGVLLALALPALGAAPAVEEGFRNPPDAAKPWVFWWWLNSYTTKEGITKDLEQMKRQGINGVLLFNAGGGAGPAGPPFMSPEWVDHFRFAVHEAERLGMEVSVNLCDGWDSGGPWITPECANKKLTYSEVQVAGPADLARPLPQPPTVDGFYRDVAVLAIPEKPGRPVAPATVSGSSAAEGYCGERNTPWEDAADHDPDTCWRTGRAPSPQSPAWLQLSYHEPLPAAGLYLAPAPNAGPRECELQASDDGKTFRTIAAFEMAKGEAKRIEFAETTARHFRLVIKSAYAGDVQLAEAQVLRKGDEPYLRPGIEWWAFKSGNRAFWDWPKQGPSVLREEYPDDGARDCRSADVLDLTAKLGAAGRLDWLPPAGTWTVLRFGYTLEGQRTRCGTTVQGYEADMLDSKGIEAHFKGCAEPLLNAVPEAVGKTLKYLHVDSYELGADVRGQQPNWSADFVREFRARRGYDPLPYLPAMARRIVDSRERTDRFLWDVRATIGDLFAERFFGRFAELAHARGIGIHCETGYGTYPHPCFDGLRTAGQCDVTMGEFWYGTDIMSQFDPFCNVIRTVASAAHVYGRKLVQAESFTAWSHFQEWPAAMKALGDRAYCDGLNRVVFHQYTHQPTDDKPGWQYGAGTHVDRNVTWWEMGRAWFRYLGRCQHLLQAGRFHADVAYFYGEGATKYVPGKEHLKPPLPEGYNFDCVNADVLLHRMKVTAGRLALPDGVSYRLLVLPDERTMSPAVLRRIRALVEVGAVVLGSPPLRAPGLSGYPQCDAEVKALAAGMWGARPAPAGERRLGKGRLFWGRTPEQVLARLGVPPDFEAAGAEGDFLFLHRVIEGGDYYFVSNQRPAAEDAECLFRVAGRQPELWDPVTGEVRPLPQFRVEKGRTVVPMAFEPSQSFFVVFRRPAAASRPRTANFPTLGPAAAVAGPWEVSFDPKWGGPEQAAFEKLEDWSKRPEEGIRHYSGTAVYRKQFDVPPAALAVPAAALRKRLWLDLGDVRNIASVRLNGKDLGVVWTAPWRVEITGRVKPAGNALEIRVANLWINRLVGDASLPAGKRFTHTGIGYGPQTPLTPSGLLGPVTLQVEVPARTRPPAGRNLALHRPTSVSSSVEAMDWRQEKLTDGDVSYPGWSSAGGLDHADHAQDPEWVVVRLKTASKIDRVVLRPRNDPQWAGQGFPEDFTIAVSLDGKAWKTVVTKKGYPAPNGGEPQVFPLEGAVGRFVKVEATRLRLAGNDYRFQLTEIEVY